MSAASTDDLITRLTAAIDELETLARQAADEVKAWGGSWTSWVDAIEHRSVIESENMSDLMERQSPDAVLRGCAADRKILALHEPLEVFAGSATITSRFAAGRMTVVCRLCDDNDNESGWQEEDLFPCGTVLAVAERYEVQP